MAYGRVYGGYRLWIVGVTWCACRQIDTLRYDTMSLLKPARKKIKIKKGPNDNR